MTNIPQRRQRIPSKTVILPPAKAFFAVTDPANPENKFDPENKNWSIRLVWEGEGRNAVEKLLGPMLPEALDAKKAELIAEAGDNAIKRKRAEEMEYETPWREVLNRETAEPTGEIEIVVKRPAMRMQRGSTQKVPNSPPLVVDARAIQTNAPIPNRATVIVKMATWPVYFAQDNKAGIKRLLESVQVIAMPEARRPDASGFEVYDDGYSAEEAQPEAKPGDKAPLAPGADY